jgi:hypothetical protein
VTTIERLEAWRQAGVITPAQHDSLAALARRDRFSVYVEISALLYIGVLSTVAGVVWTFRDYVNNLGHAAILSIFAALIAASLYYCFSRGGPYSNAEVEPPSLIFDYVLYFGCLTFSAMLAYLEVQMGVFRGWETHLLLASVVFGGLAYRFDNRFVLSLALSTLAAYLGLTLELFDRIDTDRLRLYAMGYGLVVAAVGFALYRQGVKRHFLDVYLHVGANAFLVATVSGVPSANGLLYLALLLPLAGALIYLGVRFERFAFVAYGTLYGYAGLSAKLLNALSSPTLSLAYLVITGSIVVIALVVLSRRFARNG